MMKLEVMRHLWGIDEPWERVFPKIKDLGYAGIESPLPEAHRAMAELMETVLGRARQQRAALLTCTPGFCRRFLSGSTLFWIRRAA